jgi:NADPH:quinone reductase-like Zn-dependent oxidoreductase
MKLRYKIAGGSLLVIVIALASLTAILSYDSPCEATPALASGTTSMKAIVYRCYGPPDVLNVEDIEKPVPADNEVLVKVHAAGVNPLDWHYMRGEPSVMRLMSGIGKPKETRLGVDFAGTVEAIGANVSKFKPGDEVFGARTGAFGDYVVVREDRAIVLKPDNVTFEQAAAVPIAAITALQALRDKGKLQPGQKVLINGASGGVGTFAVQIAKSFGAEVTGVCSTRNVEMVRSLGADYVVDYKLEDFTEGDKRYDLILDNVGNHPLSALRNTMNPQGILVMIGGSGSGIEMLQTSIQALLMSTFGDQEFLSFLARLKQEDLGVLSDLMREGKVTSMIDRTYPLNDVPAAIGYSEEGHARGKIIISTEPVPAN